MSRVAVGIMLAVFSVLVAPIAHVHSLINNMFLASASASTYAANSEFVTVISEVYGYFQGQGIVRLTLLLFLTLSVGFWIFRTAKRLWGKAQKM